MGEGMWQNQLPISTSKTLWQWLTLVLLLLSMQKIVRILVEDKKARKFASDFVISADI
jgi:hypothetical protein